jgi:hypothetical protein
MAPILRSRTLSVSIACPPGRVYEFVSNPENLPRWAAGLGRSVRKSGSGWIVETRDGPMTIAFVEPNPFGVLDHRVTVKPGLEISSPMRVIPNGSGSEVLFTLFQVPGMSDEKFVEDAALVEHDLRTLKKVLE